MITIKYYPNRTRGAVPDGFVEGYYERIKKASEDDQTTIITLATDNVIYRVRAGIAEGDFDHSRVTFVFEGKSFQTNQYGMIDDWPDGFCDFQGTMCERILEADVKRYRENKATASRPSPICQ
jgi:hypothetical protein